MDIKIININLDSGDFVHKKIVHNSFFAQNLNKNCCAHYLYPVGTKSFTRAPEELLRTSRWSSSNVRFFDPPELFRSFSGAPVKKNCKRAPYKLRKSSVKTRKELYRTDIIGAPAELRKILVPTGVNFYHT